MGFKDFYFKRPEWKLFSFQVDDTHVHILFDDKEAICALNEAKHKGIPLSGQYSAQVHGPHGYGQKHLHAYSKNNQLFAINWDGTAHDKSHGIFIPNKVAIAIAQRFPDLKLPNNNFIESVMPDMLDTGKLKLLLE
jgi:hypothetical protein